MAPLKRNSPGSGALNVDENRNMPVAPPRWEWTWNLNTIFQVVQLAVLLAAAVWLLGEMNAVNNRNRDSIETIDKRLTAVEADTRRLDTVELRLSAVEKQAADAAAAMRAVEGTLSTLSSDIRLVREILQRIEASQARN